MAEEESNIEKDIEEFLESRAKLLNGQLRGAINERAREENKQLIDFTFMNIFETAYSLGRDIKGQEEAFIALKQQLELPFDGEVSDT
jgi:hypothetical protein